MDRDHKPTPASLDDELQPFWQLLDEVPAEPADSARMRARFDAVLTSESRVEAARSARHASGRWALPTWQLAVAATLLLAAGLGAGVGISRLGARAAGASPAPVDPTVAELRQEVRNLRQVMTLSLLQQQSASERLKGVSATSDLDRPGREIVTALLDTLARDPNVNVRLASIDALRRFADEREVRAEAVRSLDRQTSPLVQIALIDFLVELNDRDAVGQLRRLSMDPGADPAVRQRAAWSLERIGV